MAPSPDVKILVAPLDWGLGHTTRCIPIIRELQAAGCQVLFAAAGPAARLIEQEFPGIQILPLGGYQVHFSGKRPGIQLAIQIPKIWMAIRREHRWLKALVKTMKIQAVIADNRWGLHHPEIPCVFITHQLHIITSYGIWLDRLASRINYWFIRKFTACWVPDLAGAPGLAGNLSHPASLPGPTFYLGCLSRLDKLPVSIPKYDLAILISGPEPQRTQFENKILSQLSGTGKTAVMVSGQPDKSFDLMLSPQVRHISHLPADQISKIIQESGLVICRSGYTTLMDLMKLGKRAVLIPTPGQPEQEYLAAHMMRQGWFYAVRQDDLMLDRLESALSGFPFTVPEMIQKEHFQETVREFLNGIK